MKIQQRKRFITVLYMAGFLIGIFYANLVERKYMTANGIFSEYFLSQYIAIDVEAEEYMLYVMKTRLLPLVCLFIAAQTKFKKVAVMCCILWTGFSSGMLIVASVLQLGAKGILLCLIGITPHFVFYIMAYLVILWYLGNSPVSTWNRGKSVFVVLTMALGILTEVYVNPILMKLFVNAM